MSDFFDKSNVLDIVAPICQAYPVFKEQAIPTKLPSEIKH